LERDYESGITEWRVHTFTKTGYTDASGFIKLEGFVNVDAYYPWRYKFYDMKVLMETPNYAIVSHSGDYSHLSNTTANFEIGLDYNKNDVPPFGPYHNPGWERDGSVGNVYKSYSLTPPEKDNWSPPY
jgi:hypothetical protein